MRGEGERNSQSGGIFVCHADSELWLPTAAAIQCTGACTSNQSPFLLPAKKAPRDLKHT